MTWVELDDPAIGEEVAAVAVRLGEHASAITKDVRDIIADAVPALHGDERINALFLASVEENIHAVLHILQHDLRSAIAPNAAVEYTRRLAQRDVGISPLLRAYRLGQTRFQRDFINELLRGREGDHVEGNTALRMVEVVSSYVDHVVEEIIDVYQQAREELLSHRSAIFVQRVRTLLRERNISADAAQGMLNGYLLAQHHLGAVIWCDESATSADSLSELQHCSLKLAEAAACAEPPLFAPFDESTAWLWFPLGDRTAVQRAQLEAVACAPDFPMSLALGDPLPSLSGFRRTHSQAVLAHNVAVAARPPLSNVTAFTDVAPISTMCQDLDGARAWVTETLGGLAIDDERGSVLRETARVFLANGRSFTATATQMILHRNTAQYRIRKAEELRGRPLRDGRLEVELALLACHYLGSAVLQSPQPEAEGQLSEAVLL
jgi:DNA-binding PucR family transcriptional regulator